MFTTRELYGVYLAAYAGRELASATEPKSYGDATRYAVALGLHDRQKGLEPLRPARFVEVLDAFMSEEKLLER